MRVKITADSTCDLSPELICDNHITIAPLYIMKGGKAYKDMEEISPRELFDWFDAGNGLCSTSSVNTADYTQLFSDCLKEYDGIVHFTISSDMSGCYRNACLAADGFENVYIIDSRNLSTGIGHLVLDAAELAASETMTAEEIYREILTRVDKVETSFVIDSLTYLHKGGRCSALAAFGANLLHLKPCIEVKDGVMGVGKKYRGCFRKVILQYVQDRLTGREDIDTRRLFITYPTAVPAEIAAAVEEEVRKLANFDVILHTNAGCTISGHCGPICLGILFFRK